MSSLSRQLSSALIWLTLLSVLFASGGQARSNRSHGVASSLSPRFAASAMVESHVFVDMVFCFDEETGQQVATSGFLDGGDGSHPAGFPLTYSGTNVIYSFTRPVTRAGFILKGQAGKQVVATSNTGESFTKTLEPWEIFGSPQTPEAHFDFFVSGITSITIQSVDPESPFSFGNIGFEACGVPPLPTPSPTPTPEEPPDHAFNLGESCPNQMVGEPVNVTNGNVYLQQTDFHLPGIGEAISVVRSYNSLASRYGLFGRGWSTTYDEELLVDYETDTIRFFTPNGRATDFANSGDGSYVPVQPDFFGTLIKNGDGSFSLSFKDGRIHKFDSVGALISLTDRNGNQTALARDEDGRLTSITDATGRVVSVITSQFGLVESLTDSLGPIATYAYTPNFMLRSVSYPEGSGYIFGYDSSGRLTFVSDAMGTQLEAHAYDSEGRAVNSVRANNIELYSLEYISDSETDVTDALGRVTKYFFDTSGARNVVTQVEGFCNCGSGSQMQTWTYDTNLNITSYTNGLNQVTSHTYDAQGNELTVTDADGTTANTYNEFGQTLTSTDVLGGTTSITYDNRGNPLSVTDPLNHTTNYVSNSLGQLLSITDARGKVTSFSYDSFGNLITKTDALGHATQFTYDARGRLTSRTNALGHVTAYTYDGAGRLAQVTQADNSVIGYQYDAAGRLTTFVDAKGNQTSFTYDSGYRLVSEQNALNQTITYEYDLMSNLVSRTDELGRTTNFEYDDFNQLVKTVYPEAMAGVTRLFTTVTYDAVGNVTQRTDTAGRVISYAYDDVNRVTSTTDADGRTTKLEYDELGRITALVDALGQRYRFNYDSLGRLKHLRRGAAVMTYHYDVVGNLKRRTDYNGALTVYDYDALNRLKTIRYPDATTVVYTYDKLSRPQTVTNENGTIDFDYDKINRLNSATDVFGQKISYNYDANGNRTKLSLNDAEIATSRYDEVNRLTRLIDNSGAAFTFSYDATSKMTQQKAPNGVKTTYQYDGMGRLTHLRDMKGAAPMTDYQYEYNSAGQISQIAEPTVTRSYSYDAADRLISASYSNPVQPNEDYEYDAVGNRTSSQLSASYGYQPFNRLTNTSTASYTYDANGNLTSRTELTGTTQYVWDFENRLEKITLPDGRIVNYKYDALGRLIQRTPNTGISTNFIYDSRDVIKESNSDGSTVDYLNGPGIDNKLRLNDSRLAATGPLYFLQDHLGSTTALTNSLGVSITQVSYDAFGNSSGTSLTRYDYTGRERDSDTGLLYYRARWQDPKLGRFLSEDPIGFNGGDINLYAYVHNNPIFWIDPLGEQSRADARWQPGEVEQMRRLADKVRSIPTQRRQPCCNKTWTECYAQCIENHRLDNLLPALGSALPKRLLPPFRVVKSSQPLTTIPSSVAHYVSNARVATGLRSAGRLVSRVATPVLVFEGFYDWGLLASCADLCQRNPCN